MSSGGKDETSPEGRVVHQTRCEVPAGSRISLLSADT